MSTETVIDVATLAAHLADANWRVIDCRFDLRDTQAGARSFAEATIPGAIYAHLDDDLSGPVLPGRTGRHPLPTREAFANTLGRFGIDAQTQVVAFDSRGGAFASRLWWMLRWMGHRSAAVLDGGLPAWTAAGQDLAPGGAMPSPTTFVPGEPIVEHLDADQVLAGLDDDGVVLLDARSAARFRGENEPTDPIAGHIAKARSAPCTGNLDADGRFLSADALKARFEERLAGAEPERAVIYCGSGVTACHDLLAMARAGLPLARLYPGSWSDWITDEQRPRATGEET